MNGSADPVRDAEGVREIESPDDFLAAVASRRGFLAITDRSDGTRVHKATCACVTVANFRMKVVDHHRRRGRYYASASYGALLGRFKVKPCAICGPEATSGPTR